MASTTTNLFASVLIFSLLVISPVCNACCGCTPSPPTPKVKPPPTPVVGSPVSKCPHDTLKLGVCADVLGLVHAVLGSPPSGTPCCALLQGLADAEAAVCLCTAIKANVLGLNLNVPLSLSIILSACQKDVPPSFQC